MKSDKLILGKDAIFSSDSYKTGLNNNIIVCGASGCGKTMSIAEPRLLETFNSSLIVTVTKRKLVNKFKPVFEERGYKVLDLNFANPNESNVAFDPLNYIKSEKDITHLAEALIMADPKKKDSNMDPYWDECAISLLSAEIAYTLNNIENPSFADVIYVHNQLRIEETSTIIKSSLDEYFDRLRLDEPNNFAIHCWRTFRDLPIKTASCIFSTLNACIDTVFNTEILESIKVKNKFNIIDIAKKKTVLFITTSAVNPSLNFYISLFYSQVFKNLFEYAQNQPDNQLDIPVNLICDDFATGTKITRFPEYISFIREIKLSVTMLIQSESQLVSMYGSDDATTIINNCDTYVYMGGMDMRTVRNVSERINLPFEDVMYMPVGQMYIFRRGTKPITTERWDILNNNRYKKVMSIYKNRISDEKAS